MHTSISASSRSRLRASFSSVCFTPFSLLARLRSRTRAHSCDDEPTSVQVTRLHTLCRQTGPWSDYTRWMLQAPISSPGTLSGESASNQSHIALCNSWPLSTPRLNSLQPSPSHIHPSTRARRQLLKSTETRIQIINHTARAPIHDLQIHAPLRAHFLIIPTRPQHLPAKRILIAIPAITRS
jgi:hypothetical protein